MLSTDPQSTKYVVLGDKPEFNVDETDGYDEGFLDNLIENIANLSSVYHITPDDIEVPQKDSKLGEEEQKKETKKVEKKDESDDEEADDGKQDEEEEDTPKSKPKAETEKTKQKVISDQPADLGIEDLLGLNDVSPQP